MSFSSEVKEELAKQFGRSRHCQIAELAGFSNPSRFASAFRKRFGCNPGEYNSLKNNRLEVKALKKYLEMKQICK
jgi:AraC-like DNA-binding protein